MLHLLLLLNLLGDSFSKDVETPKEEVERTGQPPEMGDQFASVATPPAPVQTASVTPPPSQLARLNLPPLPSASAPPAKRPTSFQSLFPRDELGGAIANQRGQGIMSIV